MASKLMATSTNCQYDTIHQHLVKLSSKYLCNNIMFSVAQWDTRDDSIAFQFAKGKILLGILMARVMGLHFNMQEEDILEMPIVIYVHVWSTCRPLCNIGNILNLTTLFNILK